MSTLNSVLGWIRRNERRLASVVFVAGFAGDLLTFTLLDLSFANLVFVAYLTLAAVATFLSHTISSRFDTEDAVWRRVLAVLAPLAAQYAIGALLSGILIFYTKSATLAVSWPFIAMLALVFLGNEVFRGYRAHLAFQTVLFFFTLYAYAIFALPLAIGEIGPWIFLGSTALASAAFMAFLGLLAWVGWERFRKTIRLIAVSSAGVVAVLVLCYFTSIIPPIPLTLRDSGIYHNVQHTKEGYVLLAEEERPWGEFYMPMTIHRAPGTPLYAFSAVFAPGTFSTVVAHEWEWYNPDTKKWVRQSLVAFPLSGGREGGYRGYSQIDGARPGSWRVSIQTPSGQVIGRIRFEVVETLTGPALHTELR